MKQQRVRMETARSHESIQSSAEHEHALFIGGVHLLYSFKCKSKLSAQAGHDIYKDTHYYHNVLHHNLIITGRATTAINIGFGEPQQR